MVSILSVILSYLSPSTERKVLLVGLDKAGKTSLAKEISDICEPRESPIPTVAKSANPTVGQNVHKVNWQDHNFVFWDVGGEESLRSIWTSWYVKCDAVVFVIDSADKERLDIAIYELSKLLRFDKLDNDKTYPVIVACNKQELRDSVEIELVLDTMRTANIHVRNLELAEGSAKGSTESTPVPKGRFYVDSVLSLSVHYKLGILSLMFRLRNIWDQSCSD